jgi:hypothetical protein
MDQKIKTISFVLAALVLPLAAIMLIMFSVTVSVAVPIYEFLSHRPIRRRLINERHNVLTKFLATPRATQPARHYKCKMSISRVTAGFVMIGVSIALLIIPATEASEVKIGIAWGAFLENLIAIIALVLLSFGVQFAFFSKPCPVCDEKLSRAAGECRHCGYNFETAPPRISRGPYQSYSADDAVSTPGGFATAESTTKTILEASRKIRKHSRDLVAAVQARIKQLEEIMARSKALVKYSSSLTGKFRRSR